MATPLIKYKFGITGRILSSTAANFIYIVYKKARGLTFAVEILLIITLCVSNRKDFVKRNSNNSNHAQSCIKSDVHNIV